MGLGTLGKLPPALRRAPSAPECRLLSQGLRGNLRPPARKAPLLRLWEGKSNGARSALHLGGAVTALVPVFSRRVTCCTPAPGVWRLQVVAEVLSDTVPDCAMS